MEDNDLNQNPLTSSCMWSTAHKMRNFCRVYREMEDQMAEALKDSVGMANLKKIHAHIIVCSMSQSNYLATKLVSMCDVNGAADYGESVFKQIMEPNTFLYNAMVKAFTHSNAYSKALALYRQMLRHHTDGEISVSPDKFTYPFVFKACAGLVLLGVGKQVHVQLQKSGWNSVSVIENTLLEMYTKCDALGDAHVLFDGMTERDTVSWNTVIAAHARLLQMRKARCMFDSMPDKTVISWTILISGYTLAGRYADALEVFQLMQLSGVKPDDVAIVSVLPACAQLGALELGRWIHTFSDKNEMLRKTHVCNALIEMYAKCGCIIQAQQLFDDIAEKDVISWSTMISGLAHHGLASAAIALFIKMVRDGKVKPNGVTFLALLSACAHAGYLGEGLHFFDSMNIIYGLNPGIEHYGCVVDLLGRSGCIDQALQLIKCMPVPPDAATWGSLLSACKTYGDVETAVVATKHLIEIEPNDTGNYVILSNIYAATRRWDGVSEMRKLIRTSNIRKTPGCSSIEVDNVVREFVAGDDANQQFAEMSTTLELLAFELSETDAACALATMVIDG